mgnify:CR=1 FL=1
MISLFFRRSMKNIGLVAHDDMKDDLVKFVKENESTFNKMKIYSTGTTGARLLESMPSLDITPLASGPIGGDLQIGSLIVEDKLDTLIFLWDPMSPHPHDVDVKALLRIAVIKNIRLACNLATAKKVIQPEG